VSQPPTPATVEMFHAIAHTGSANARRVVVEREIGERVRFRNVAYPEVTADFAARGGKELPALWDGTTLIQGEADVIAALERIAAERG
jgi:hypothetical protein